MTTSLTCIIIILMNVSTTVMLWHYHDVPHSYVYPHDINKYTIESHLLMVFSFYFIRIAFIVVYIKCQGVDDACFFWRNCLHLRSA